MRNIFLVGLILLIILPTVRGDLFESGFSIGGADSEYNSFYMIDENEIVAKYSGSPVGLLVSDNDTLEDIIKNKEHLVLLSYTFDGNEYVENGSYIMEREENAGYGEFDIVDEWLYIIQSFDNGPEYLPDYYLLKINMDDMTINESVYLDISYVYIWDIEVVESTLYMLIKHSIGSVGIEIMKYDLITGENNNIDIFPEGLEDHGPIIDMAISDQELWVWVGTSKDSVRSFEFNDGAIMQLDLESGERIQTIDEDPTMLVGDVGFPIELNIFDGKLFAFFSKGYVVSYQKSLAISTEEPARFNMVGILSLIIISIFKKKKKFSKPIDQ